MEPFLTRAAPARKSRDLGSGCGSQGQDLIPKRCRDVPNPFSIVCVSGNAWMWHKDWAQLGGFSNPNIPPKPAGLAFPKPPKLPMGTQIKILPWVPGNAQQEDPGVTPIPGEPNIPENSKVLFPKMGLTPA